MSAATPNNTNLQRAQESLRKLRIRSMCFDLAAEFFDRAERENNTSKMQAAYDLMVDIHAGKSARRALNSQTQVG